MNVIRFKKFVSVLLVSVLVVAAALLVPEIESKAATSSSHEFYVKYPEPTADEFSGYFLVSYWNPSTQQNVTCCYFWHLTPSWQFAQESGVDISFCMNVELTNDNQFVFTPYCEGTSMQLVQFGYYNADDNYRIKMNYGSNGNAWKFTDDYSQYSINGYIYGGNVGTIKGANAWNNVNTPVVHFSNSVDALELYYRLDLLVSSLTPLHDLVSSLGNQSSLILQGNNLQKEENKLQQESNSLQQKENELQEESNKQQKGFFDNFFDNLVDTIVSIFVPDTGYFTDYFDRLYVFFSEKLGFLVYPFELMADFISAYLSIGEGSGQIVISDVVMFDTVLIQATTFDLKGAMSDILGDYYDLYYAFVDCILIFGFVAYGMKKFNSVVGGTGE